MTKEKAKKSTRVISKNEEKNSYNHSFNTIYINLL